MERKISIIAGPCSAESLDQMTTVAEELQESGVSWYRAGVWKPRTKPGSFEGIGEAGMKWLKHIQDYYKFNCMTEVANAHHVKLALDYGLKGVWIGARTSVNPFYVQEIADALSGADIDVFVKNPINPDLKLWEGALERVQKANVRSVAAIHRGFASYTKSKFRNDPVWQIPIELMTAHPDLAVYCDISHIAGDRSLLHEIAQKAMDLNYDGLMIESHPNPSKALSDREQQLKPQALVKLLNKLIIRTPTEDAPENETALLMQRAEIDQIDQKLMELLAQRMEISEDIGKIKRENQLSVLSAKRWAEIIERALEVGQKGGLSDQFIKNIYRSIHDESIERQISILKASNISEKI